VVNRNVGQASTLVMAVSPTLQMTAWYLYTRKYLPACEKNLTMIFEKANSVKAENAKPRVESSSFTMIARLPKVLWRIAWHCWAVLLLNKEIVMNKIMYRFASAIVAIALTFGSFFDTKALSFSLGQVISGDITTPVILDGHSYDGTIIDGAVIHNTGSDAIVLRNVDNVIIRNSEIYGVENGILFRSTGSTKNTLIENNNIHDTTSQGIMVKTDDISNLQTDVIIRNNTLANNGNNQDSEHGMYIMGYDTQIIGNRISGSSGNGISIRTSGVVSGNTITGSGKSCIRYFSDHKSGQSQKLVIENNLCINPPSGYAGISLLYGGSSDMVNDYVIRFNTVIGNDSPSIRVESADFAQYNVAIYGNLLIKQNISTAYVDYLAGNYYSSTYNLNTDFTLPIGNSAIGFADNVRDFPANDIVGKPRIVNQLDAGAFVFVPTTTSGATATAVPTTIAPVATPITMPAGQNTFDVRVVNDADDVEESSDGRMHRHSNYLELIYDGSNQVVGIRFRSVNIPKGATITNAYLQFKVGKTSSNVTSLFLQGGASSNALAFASASYNVSSRLRTKKIVSWSPSAWLTLGAVDASQRTPNIASIIQEIIGQSGWASGNSMVIIITGNGKRVAEAYEVDPAGAPLLHIEYTIP
jgi:hypothetical protein